MEYSKKISLETQLAAVCAKLYMHLTHSQRAFAFAFAFSPFDIIWLELSSKRELPLQQLSFGDALKRHVPLLLSDLLHFADLHFGFATFRSFLHFLHFLRFRNALHNFNIRHFRIFLFFVFKKINSIAKITCYFLFK